MIEIAVNPFSSRFVRPGAMPFLYAAETADLILGRFAAGGRRGAIIGPHGSGKSALLRDLLRRMTQAGEKPHLIELRDGQRKLPADWLEVVNSSNATLIAVDGYEQLGWFASLGLRRHCRRRDLGLIVTAHRSVELPVIAETHSDERLAQRIVAQLWGETQIDESAKFTANEVAECFCRHQPNLREMLFELYDVCERKRHAS